LTARMRVEPASTFEGADAEAREVPAGRRPQVQASHYEGHYETVERWASYFHQVREILRWTPRTVLEVGPGSGFVAAHLERQGVHVTTLDIDPALRPDVVGSVDGLGVNTDSMDVVSCCQILEHIPFDRVPTALKELRRVARAAVVMSVPDVDRVFQFSVRSPVSKGVRFTLRLPLPKRVHRFDGQHYWEVNRRGHSFKRVRGVIEDAGFTIKDTYRVFENPYHRFFILTP
jgi:ubiquinone/menaquinone biosynthesis C-methylase UbiE